MTQWTVRRTLIPAYLPRSVVRGRLFRVVLVVVACLALAAVSQPVSAKDYQNYDEAMADAQTALKAKNYLASEEPLEAAVALAEDDFARIKAYRLLFDAYKLHTDIDDMLQASEFILDHSQNTPEKSITRNTLLEYVAEKEKEDFLIEHFEKRIAKNENDQTALFVLSEAYASLKEEPAKGAHFLERLTKQIEDSGEKVDVLTKAHLAALYVKAAEYQKGAELFEKIAPEEETMIAWHWKEAASAWLKAGEKEKALQAAMTSTKLGPEKRSGLLSYYWNNSLGDIYFELDNTKLAIDHYEAALKTPRLTNFYVQKTQASLAKARAKKN